MDITLLQQIKDLLAKNDEVAIAVGKNPTIDDMGAALSFYLALKTIGKKVSIAAPSEPLVEISSLVGIDKVKTYFDTKGGDLVVSFPYNEGEIEKVSYTLENGFLNIIVKAGEKGLSFEEKDVDYKRGGGNTKLLFIIGTSRLSDLGTLFDPETLKNTTIVNIDNKRENQGFGDVVFVSSSASSVCEQIATMLTHLDYPLDVDIAQNLLSGISFATDNFGHSKTTPLAFEMAALLLKKGATRTRKTTSFFPQGANPITEEMGSIPHTQSNPMQKRNFSLGSNQRDPFAQRDKSSLRTKLPQQQFPRQQSQAPSFTRSVPQIPSQMVEAKDETTEETPPDWLAPKVYKGSTLV